MELSEMLELILLVRLGEDIDKWSNLEYDEFADKYDVDKIAARCRELYEKFLTPYVIDKSVTALVNNSQL